MSKDRHDRMVKLTVDRGGDTFQRIEVISGIGRRRDWSDELKARLVEESLEDGVMISDVARRHGVPP
jgi:Transposase